MDEIYEYNGKQYSYAQLKDKYGDRVDDAISKFGFKKIEPEETFSYKDKTYSRSDLEAKYGDKTNEAIEKFGFVSNLKKKEDSESTSKDTSLVSQETTESGSLATQDTRGQLVKDIDAGKFDERISELQSENDAIAQEDEQRLNGLLERYKQNTSFNTEDFNEVQSVIDQENDGNFGWMRAIGDFAAQAWTGQKPLSPKEIAINKIVKEKAKAQNIDIADVDKNEAEQDYITSRKKELNDAKKEKKQTDFIASLSDEDKNILTKHFSVEAGKLDAKNASRLIEGKAIAKDIEKLDQQIAEIKANHDDTQDYPLEYYQNNQQLEVEREQLKQQLNTVVTELGEDETNLLSTKEELDLFKRNYGTWANFSGKLGIAGEEMLVDFGYLMNKVNQINPLLSDEQFKASEEGAAKIKKGLQKEREGLRKNIAVSEIESVGDLTTWALDLVAEQAPQTALMVTTGGSSLPLMGVTAAGSKLYDIEAEQRAGVEYSNLQKYGSVAISGIVEPLSEKISLGQISKAKRVFSSVAKQELKENTVDWLKRSFPEYVKDILEEGGSEAVAQLAENISDKYLLGKDVNIIQGLDDAFVSGAFMSGVVYKLPGLVPRFIPKDTNQKLGENSQKIIAFNQQLQNELSPEVKQSIEAQRDALLQENDKLLNKSFKNLDQLSKEDKGKILDIENSIYNARKEGKTIQEEPNLDDKIKDVMLKAVSKKLENLDAEKTNLLNAKTEQDTKEAPKPEMETPASETEVSQKNTNKLADLNNNDNFVNDENSTETQLDNRGAMERSSERELVGRRAGEEGIYLTAEASNDGGGQNAILSIEEREELESRGINPDWDKSKFKTNLKEQAKKNGVWLDDSYLEDKTQVHDQKADNTTENDVYINADGKTVTKVNNLNTVTSGENANNLNAFIDRIEAHNTLFPEDKITIIGYGNNKHGESSVVMEQSYIDAERNATEKEISDYLESNGFKLDGTRAWSNGHQVWSNGIYELYDARPANVIKGKDGKLHFFDTIPHSVAYMNKVKQNETKAQGDTITNENVSSGTAKSEATGQVENVPPAVDGNTYTGKVEVRRINPKGVKGEFDVTFDGNGNVLKIHSKDGREVPKFVNRKVKPTKKNPTGKKPVRNGNYSKIEAEAKGVITENQSTVERKNKLKEAKENFNPSTPYEYALNYFLNGGRVKLGDSKSQGNNAKTGKWASGFNKETNLPSIEQASEMIWQSDPENIDQREVRNELENIVRENSSIEDLENTLLDIYTENELQQREAELYAYKNSLSKEELAIFESTLAEEDYLSELTYEEKIEYYETQFEQPQETYGERNGSTTSVQERSGAQDSETEVDDSLQQQGISLNKESKRDLALSEEGSVRAKDERQRKFKRFWNNTFSSLRGLTKETVREVESLFGELSALSEAVKFEASQFGKISKAIKRQSKTKYNEKMRLVNDYLNGKTVDVSFLKPEHVDMLDAFRARIDGMSDKIIDALEAFKSRLTNEDAIARVDALIETIQNNKGQYIFRQYQAFSDKDYLNRLTSKFPNSAAKKRLQNAIDFVVQDQNISEAEAKTQILTYLDNIKNDGSMVSAATNGKAKAPFLKKRKDIPKPIRELLGESKDPVRNYVSTIFNMGKYIANLEYQNKLHDHLFDAGIAKDTMEEGYTRLTSSDSEWGMLQDVYVPEEVKNAINDLQPLGSVKDPFYKHLIMFAAATKVGKTVLSPTTTARNFLSGFFLSMNAGFSPFVSPKKFATAIHHAWGSKKSNTALKSESQRLIKLGVTKDGAVSGEILGIMNDFSAPIEKQVSKSGLKKVMDVMQRLYAMGDDTFKVIGFYQWEKRYLKAGYSALEAEQLAVDNIRNGFPTYSKIPKNIQQLRRIPLVGTFPSFAYEVWRTNINNIKFIGDDLKRANNKDLDAKKRKAHAKFAAQRVSGMAIATSTAWALSELTKSMFGISDEEDETTRNMAAEWQKDSKNIYVGKTGTGNYDVIDATAFFPQETIMKPIRILFEDREGRTIDDKIGVAIEEATEAFVGADIFTKTMVEVFSNENNYGKEIYEGNNILEGIANDGDKLTHYILKQAGPGAYNNLTEFARANEIAPDYFGDKETKYKEYTNEEALLGLLGVRLSRINYLTGMSSLGFEAKSEYTDKRTKILRELKTYKELSEKDILKIVEDYKAFNKENHKHILVAVRGAKKQGIDENLIKKTLDYSEDDKESIINGYAPYLKPMSQSTINKAIKNSEIGKDKDNPQKLSEINRILNRNKDLFNELVRQENEKSWGLRNN